MIASTIKIGESLMVTNLNIRRWKINEFEELENSNRYKSRRNFGKGKNNITESETKFL